MGKDKKSEACVVKLGRKNNREMFVLFIIFCGCFLLNLSLIHNDSVWCDEAYTMIQCRNTFSSMIENAKVDAWPPFYTVASWMFAQIFGVTVPVLKFFSLIPAILTMILGMTYIYKEFKSVYISGMFILLNGIMPISMHMNIEIRGYSWGMFFVTLCGILSFEYYMHGQKKSTFVSMILAGLLAAYTHYFAVVAVAIVYIMLFLGLVLKNWKNLKICLVVTIICFLGYLPWLVNFFKAAESVASGYWISSIRFSKLAEYLLYPFTNYFDNFGNVTVSDFSFIYAVICLFIALQLIVKVYFNGVQHSKEEVFALLCLAVWLGVIISGYLVSRIISPMFVARYMYFAVGLLWLFLAIGSYICIKDKHVIIIWIALILTVGIYGYAGRRKAEYENGTEKAKQVIMEHYENNIGIFSDSDYLNWTEIKYYFPESIHSESGGNVDVITNKGKRETFLFLCTDKFSEYKKSFEKMGYKITELGQYDFDGCYEFELYKMTKNVAGMSLIVEESASDLQNISDLHVRVNVNGNVLFGHYSGDIKDNMLDGKGYIVFGRNKLDVKKITGKFKKGELVGNVELDYYDGSSEKVKVEDGYFTGRCNGITAEGVNYHFTYNKGMAVGKILYYDEEQNIIGQDWYYNGQKLSELIEASKEYTIQEYFTKEEKIKGKTVKIEGSVELVFPGVSENVICIKDVDGNRFYVKYLSGRYNWTYSTLIPKLQIGDEVVVYGRFNGVKENIYVMDEKGYGYFFPEISSFYIRSTKEALNIFEYADEYDYEEICKNSWYYAYKPISVEGIIEYGNIKYDSKELYCKVITDKKEIYYLILAEKVWDNEYKYLKEGEQIAVKGELVGDYNHVKKYGTGGMVEIMEQYPLVKVSKIME